MLDPLEGVTDDGSIRTGADRSRVPVADEPVAGALVTAFEEGRAVTASAADVGRVLGARGRAQRVVDAPSDVIGRWEDR